MAETMSQPGVLLLASRILDDSAALTGLDFARWGEDTCVSTVQATGGVSHTLRYESLGFMKKHRSAKDSQDHQKQHKNDSFPYDFLDVYFMPDIAFTESEAFRQLPIAGDAEITGNMDASKLLERLLMQTELHVRLCADTDPGASDIDTVAPAPFLITARTSYGWLPDELLSRCQIMGRFQLRSAFTVSAMEREEQSTDDSDEVILLACNSLRGFEAYAEGSLEIALWGLRKVYTGNERTAAAWRPGVRI